jgi:hypothetical protein
MLGIYRVAAQVVASRVVLISTELVSYWAEVEPSPLLLRQFIGLFYQPWKIDGDDFGAIDGMNEWQGQPAPVCPPQISHDFTGARTRATVVASRRLTAISTAQPSVGRKLNSERAPHHSDVTA